MSLHGSDIRLAIESFGWLEIGTITSGSAGLYGTGRRPRATAQTYGRLLRKCEGLPAFPQQAGQG